MNRMSKTPIREGSTIASILHDRMVRTGATESDVAGLIGIDQTQIGRWRRGRTVPRASALLAISEWLNVDVLELEAVRVESERVRADVSSRKKGSPAVEFTKIKAELKASKAKIKRLELQLSECLAANKELASR
jgi:transcriptional regulator with XRE-family HTH domain